MSSPRTRSVPWSASTRPPRPCTSTSGRPPRPGQAARYDYQYDRMGTCSLFLCSAPLLGWRAVTVRTRRTAVDCAHVLKELVDVHFPEAETIVLVCDNLNTHTPKSLYKAFDRDTADRLAARFEWHYTPPHGSQPAWPSANRASWPASA